MVIAFETQIAEHRSGGETRAASLSAACEDRTLKLNQLFATRRRLVALGAGQLDKPSFDLGKQRRRQWAVVARFSIERSDIRSRPNKPVALGQDNPGAVV